MQRNDEDKRLKNDRSRVKFKCFSCISSTIPHIRHGVSIPKLYHQEGRLEGKLLELRMCVVIAMRDEVIFAGKTAIISIESLIN